MQILPQTSCSRISHVLAFVFVLLLLTASQALAASGTLSAGPSPIWMGNIQVGKSTTVPCTLKNSGNASLTISKATSSNSVYSLASPALPLTLTVGKAAACSIKFIPKTMRRETGTIAFVSNASNSTASISLSGWGVEGRTAASPTSVNFGSVAAGGKKMVSEILTNTGNSTLTISSANTKGSAFGRTGITPPVTLGPGASITFTLFFVPKTSGASTGSITVLSNGSNGTFTIPLSGTGTSGGTLAVSPTTASMGSVTVGSTKTMAGQLTAGSTSVTVSSVSTTNSEFSVGGISFPAAIAAGKSVPFNLVFAPKSSGATSGTVTFASNVGKAAESVSGTGSAQTTTTHKVALTWKGSTSTVTGYNVYRSGVSGGPFQKTSSSVKSTSYTDSSVQAGQTYYYVVTSIASTGKESAYSNQVKAIVP